MAEYNPFAVRVISIDIAGGNVPYLPSPGGSINDPLYNDASKALGHPVGGGTFGAGNSSIVSLGGFGGQIILAFDHDVEDNPANPFGVDAIVFGNAFWVNTYYQAHNAEFGTIEIMSEVNGDDIPGNDPAEKWYLIPGGMLSDASSFRSQQWQSTIEGYPAAEHWPYLSSLGSYQTESYELFPLYEFWGGRIGVVRNPNILDANSENDDIEAYWGYAEFNPTVRLGDRDIDNDTEGVGDVCDIDPALFYTLPDDPCSTGITIGSGGGDGFDIAWAVDGQTWQKANLQSFRYIRLTSCVDVDLGTIGEVSTEIDAVADVRPYADINGDDKVDNIDYAIFMRSWNSQWDDAEFNSVADINVDNVVDVNDFYMFIESWQKYY